MLTDFIPQRLGTYLPLAPSC